MAIKDFRGKPIVGDDMSLKSFGMSERSGYAQSHTVFNEPEVHGVSQQKRNTQVRFGGGKNRARRNSVHRKVTTEDGMTVVQTRTAGRHQSTVKVQSVEGQMDLLEQHHAEPGVYCSLVAATPNRTSDLRLRERGSAVPKRFNSSFAMQTADVPDIPRSSYGDSIIGGSSMGRQGIATQQAGRLSRPPLDSRALTKPTTAEGSKRPRLFDRITVNTKELTDK